MSPASSHFFFLGATIIIRTIKVLACDFGYPMQQMFCPCMATLVVCVPVCPSLHCLPWDKVFSWCFSHFYFGIVYSHCVCFSIVSNFFVAWLHCFCLFIRIVFVKRSQFQHMSFIFSLCCVFALFFYYCNIILFSCIFLLSIVFILWAVVTPQIPPKKITKYCYVITVIAVHFSSHFAHGAWCT